MNILFCGDENVCDGIFLSSLSLAEYNEEELNVYILTASVAGHTAIRTSFADKLEDALNDKEERCRVSLIDMTDAFADYLPLANMSTRFTPLCMLRLFADKIDAIPDKILYLDADVMCCSSIKELYSLDVSEFEIAGVPDRYGKWFFGNIFRHDYLNSGVLLLNMKAIRESGLFENCRRMCRDKKMFMPDQSALNKLAIKKKLPERYNCQGKMKKDTALKHFTTFFKFFPYFHPVTIKQWDADRMHNELGIFVFDDILDKYQRSK